MQVEIARQHQQVIFLVVVQGGGRVFVRQENEVAIHRDLRGHLTQAALAGERQRCLGLQVQRYIRRNFTLEADLGYQYQHYLDFDVNQVTYEAALQGTWKLNREAWLVGRLQQEYFQSASDGGSYPTTTATIGLRLQR